MDFDSLILNCIYIIIYVYCIYIHIFNAWTTRCILLKVQMLPLRSRPMTFTLAILVRHIPEREKQAAYLLYVWCTPRSINHQRKYYKSVGDMKHNISAWFDQTICLPIHPTIHPSIHTSIHSIYPSISLSIRQSIHLSVIPSVHLSNNASIYPSIHCI